MNNVNTKNVTLPKWVRLMFKSSSKERQTNSTKIQKLMKTTFHIIVIIFGLQSSLLFANGTSAQTIYSDLLPYPSIDIINTMTELPAISAAELKELAPVNPPEADFSENDLVPLSTPATGTLAPAIPKEAGFDDSDADNLNLMLPDLAPKTPGEADFMDANTTDNEEAGNLAPIVPAEAGFEDLV